MEKEDPGAERPGGQRRDETTRRGSAFQAGAARKVNSIQGLRSLAGEFDRAGVGSVINNDSGGGFPADRSPPRRVPSQDGGLEPP